MKLYVYRISNYTVFLEVGGYRRLWYEEIGECGQEGIGTGEENQKRLRLVKRRTWGG